MSKFEAIFEPMQFKFLFCLCFVNRG